MAPLGLGAILNENFLRGEYVSIRPPPVSLRAFLLTRGVFFVVAFLTEIFQPCVVECDARVVDVMRRENGLVVDNVARFAAPLAQAKHRRDVAISASLPSC